MNEQIDKLLVKAGAYFGGEGVVYDRFDPKKFVELIVKECRQVVKVEIETNCKPCEEWGRDDWEQGYVAGMWAATRFMKAHFGIEEYEKT